MGRLRVGVALTVTAVWAAVYLVDALNEKFSAPPEVSGVMLGVVTWLFGREIRERLKGEEDG